MVPSALRWLDLWVLDLPLGCCIVQKYRSLNCDKTKLARIELADKGLMVDMGRTHMVRLEQQFCISVNSHL